MILPPRVPSVESTRRDRPPKGGIEAAAASAGLRRQPGTRCCPRFEKRGLDSLPHRFGRWFEGRASLFNFCNQYLPTSTTTDRSNLDRVSPVEDSSGAASRPERSPSAFEVRGQASTDARRLPLRLLAGKSFAPTSSASSISRRGSRVGPPAWRDRLPFAGRHHGHRLRNGGR
jgi:hypothetical protein